MAKIKKNTSIRAPVAQVWDYVNDPNNLLEIWPSLHEVKNVQMRDDGAQSFDWTYRMAGIPFHGRSETVDMKPHQLFVMRSEGGIPSTFTWNFSESGGETHVDLEVDYEIPGKLMEKLAERFVHRANERETETLLENLKARLEAGTQTRKGAGPTEARP